MFARPDSGERAVLVQFACGSAVTEEVREEFRLLVHAAGAQEVGWLSGTRHAPDPRWFIGSGKAETLRQLVTELAAELVVFDHALSPAQERNLERLIECRVVDRNGLILDIFAQRARSLEGKLQVELAQLKHLSTRLVRGWTHLERQKGGIGLRGPGETQLETDRRLLAKRIVQIEQRLQRIETRRAQNRRARERAALPTVALVGYTNAGKSTLFNQLTAAGAWVADQLFATLDPTLRRVMLPGAGTVIVADTVGFIAQLPHELIAAFRATLEETRRADLLLHVIDASAEHRDRRRTAVEAVLAELGADRIPCLQVYNKIDRLAGEKPRCVRGAHGEIQQVWLSAATGAGCEHLLAAITERLHGALSRQHLALGPSDGALRAWLYAHGQVLAETPRADGGWELDVAIAPARLEQRLAQRTAAHQTRSKVAR